MKCRCADGRVASRHVRVGNCQAPLQGGVRFLAPPFPFVQMYLSSFGLTTSRFPVPSVIRARVRKKHWITLTF